MQRARLMSNLLDGLNSIVNLGSEKHYKDVFAVYKDETRANEIVAMEMRLAAENTLMKYKQEVKRGGF